MKKEWIVRTLKRLGILVVSVLVGYFVVALGNQYTSLEHNVLSMLVTVWTAFGVLATILKTGTKVGRFTYWLSGGIVVGTFVIHEVYWNFTGQCLSGPCSMF
jgi:hypothetical protein